MGACEGSQGDSILQFMGLGCSKWLSQLCFVDFKNQLLQGEERCSRVFQGAAFVREAGSILGLSNLKKYLLSLQPIVSKRQIFSSRRFLTLLVRRRIFLLIQHKIVLTILLSTMEKQPRPGMWTFQERPGYLCS